MGTSSARRPPGTLAWRRGRSLAGRYLAPEPGSPVTAMEVVSSYLLAVADTHASIGEDLLGAFRLTRKVAQRLGEFGDLAARLGLTQALEALGLPESSSLAPEALLVRLGNLWVGEEGSLEAAVVRSALSVCLAKGIGAASSASKGGSRWVQEFLAQVITRRLVSDLGEAMEAAAPHCRAFRKGMEDLEREVEARIAGTAPQEGPQGKWIGLAGWLYVTRLLEGLIHGFKEANPRA